MLTRILAVLCALTGLGLNDAGAEVLAEKSQDIALVASSEPAVIPFKIEGAFVAGIPENWTVRQAWEGDNPSVAFTEVAPEGDYYFQVYKYPEGNPLKMTLRKYQGNLEAAAPKSSKVREKIGRKIIDVYKALKVPASTWQHPHFDPDETVLGPSGGDFTRKNRLLRCRKKGAWEKYEWYREAYGKQDELKVYYELLSPDDKKVIETCLGIAPLATIEKGLKPDPNIHNLSDAEIENLARKDDKPPREPPARLESLYTEPGKDGFYVIRYESLAALHMKRYNAFLRFIASFKSE